MTFDAAALLFILGRILLGGLFVLGGVRHFFLLAPLTQMMAARVPFPRALLIAGSVFQTIAGALLMLGLYAAPAALGLVAFTMVASIMLLNFWDMQQPAREGAFNAFMSNGAIIGGLLIAAATAL